MAFCAYCGNELPPNVEVCPSCGAVPTAASQPAYQPPQQTYQPPQQTQPTNTYNPPSAAGVEDSGSIWWGVLGFFIPIVGLILFLVWRNTKPNCAKVAGMGALISVILAFIFNGAGFATKLFYIH